MTERLVEVLRWLHTRLDRRLTVRTRRVLLLVAAVVFVGGGLLALSELDVDADRIAWTPLLVAGLVGVPASALVNAAEYAVTARLLERRVGMVPALRVSVLSTAANLLPIPGAAMVRIRAIRELGPGYGSATSATVVVGLLWIGVSAALAGGWLTATGAHARGLPFLGIAVVVLVAAVAVLRRTVRDPGRRRRLTAAAVAVEVTSVAVSAARIVLVLAALGSPPSVVGGLVLAVSGSMAAAAGVFPAGLGLRELIAAGLAPLAGLPPAAGFAASAVNRVLGILVHAPITAALSVTVSRSEPAGHPPPGGDGEPQLPPADR